MATASRVLVIDDEPMVREVLGRYLERDGFEVATADDGVTALEAFAATDPDLVLLDLMLPRIDGFEVFRRIREARPASPVIMLTARGAVTDRIAGLETGADDYIAKPFSPKEVVARVRTVLRRSGGPAGPRPAEPPLRAGDLTLDPRTREVMLAGEPIALTPREFELLHHLASHPGTVFSRYDLLDALWDVAYRGDPATVTVHVRRLREKIERDPSRPERLLTVWGVGYRFAG